MASQILDHVGTVLSVIGFAVLIWGSFKFGGDIINRRVSTGVSAPSLPPS